MPCNFVADSFHTKKLRCRLSSSEVGNLLHLRCKSDVNVGWEGSLSLPEIGYTGVFWVWRTCWRILHLPGRVYDNYQSANEDIRSNKIGSIICLILRSLPRPKFMPDRIHIRPHYCDAFGQWTELHEETIVHNWCCHKTKVISTNAREK